MKSFGFGIKLALALYAGSLIFGASTESLEKLLQLSATKITFSFTFEG